MVGVLILVDEHIAELPLIVLPDVVEALEQPDRHQDDVVKIHGVGRLELSLVAQIGLPDSGCPEVGLPSGVFDVLLRGNHPVLCCADGVERGFGRKGLFVKIHIPNDLLHDSLGIRGIVDGKAPVIAQPVDLPAKDPAAGRVKGHGPDVCRRLAQHILQPLLEFAGRLVGKGNGNHIPGLGRLQGAEAFRPRSMLRVRVLRIIRKEFHILLGDFLRNLLAVRGSAVSDQIGDPVDQYRGLPAARSGQKEQRSLGRHDRLELHGIQVPVGHRNDLSARLDKSLFFPLVHSVSFNF